MVRIVYAITAFNEPERVARLVNRVQTESDSVFIHFDRMIGEKRFIEWKKIIEKQCKKTNVEVVSKFRCKYGSFGLVDVNLSLMRSLEDYDYVYYIDLTEKI